MVAVSGVTGGSVAATAGMPVAAQEDNESDGAGNESGGGGESGNESDGGGGGNESESGNESGGGGGGGGTEEVTVGPGGDPSFEPAELTIAPGTTVVWIWDSDNHNIHPDNTDQWEGHQTIESAGFEYEHTFEEEGEYHYVCDPHVGQGMEGDIIVQEGGGGGGGGGEADVDIHSLGVPIQKHYIGIATILAIFVSLVFTFYLLKYGESAHTSSPGRK